MNHIFVLIILLSIMLFSCSDSKKQNKILPISNIEPIKINDLNVGLFEYIPLETNTSILISQIDKIISDNQYYYILDTKSKYGLFLFNKKGKFIRTISIRGKGPGEFLYVYDFDIDKDGNSFLLDGDRQSILKFDSLGVFQEKFDYKFKAANFACVGDNLFIFFQKGRKQSSKKYDYELILWYSKTKIKSTFLPNSQRSVPYGKFSSIYRSNNSLFYCNYFGNIIYEIKEGAPDIKYFLELGSLYPNDNMFFNNLDDSKNVIKSIDVINSEYFNCLSDYYETSELVTFRINKGRQKLLCFLWKNKQDFYVVHFNSQKYRKDVKIHFSPSKIIGVDNDYFLTTMMPYSFSNLKRSLTNKSINIEDEKFSEILSKINPSDNPIIVKFKFNSNYEDQVGNNHIAHID